MLEEEEQEEGKIIESKNREMERKEDRREESKMRRSMTKKVDTYLYNIIFGNDLGEREKTIIIFCPQV